MRLKNLAILSMICLCFAACKDDEEKTCTQSDWVSQYTGTENCGGTNEAAVVVITASGATDIMIAITSGGEINNYDAITPDNCEAAGAFDTPNGEIINLEATLNGSNLELKTDCTYTLAKI